MYINFSKDAKSKWGTCHVNEVQNVRTDQFYTSWQIYTDQTTMQYGPVYGNFCFDFDGDLDEAKQDCLKIYNYFLSNGVTDNNINALFSGNKGFHLEIDYRSFMDKPEFDLHLIYKVAAMDLNKSIKGNRDQTTMDLKIYSIRRLFRYANSIHNKTGLYCIPITHEELEGDIKNIIELAKSKRDIKKEHSYSPSMVKLFENAKTFYFKSCTFFENKFSVEHLNNGNYPPCIDNILNNGVNEGERNYILYLLMRHLKKFETEEKLSQITMNYAHKNNIDEKEALSTMRSALKRHGSFLSCLALKGYCNKELCDSLASSEKISTPDLFFKTLDIEESKKELIKNINNGKYNRKITTGIKCLDNCSVIVQDSIVVIASLSNVGKTSLAVTIARANKTKNISYLGVEEGQDRTVLRLLDSGIPACKNIKISTRKNCSIDNTAIRSYFHYNSDSDLIIIDQLINLDSKTKEERLKYKSLMEEFRALTSEYNIPVILIHQLNRKSISEIEPCKEMLAEGADIERLAYDVWLLYRVKIGNKTINMLKIDKAKFSKVPLYIPLEYNVNNNTFQDYNFDVMANYLNLEELNTLKVNLQEIRNMDIEKNFKQKIDKICGNKTHEKIPF